MSDLNERVGLVEHWWKGNGTKGAEERLQEQEKKTNSIINRLNIMIVLVGLLTIASAPDLLKLLGLL